MRIISKPRSKLTSAANKVGSHSGGERGRLHLAKTMLSGGNVLLLDEPSNDLDVETLRAPAAHPLQAAEGVELAP